jgi:hypothetical protein
MECARKQCEDTAQDFWSDINFIHGVGQNALKAQFPGETKSISTGMPQHRVVYLSSSVASFRPRLLPLSYFERDLLQVLLVPFQAGFGRRMEGNAFIL